MADLCLLILGGWYWPVRRCHFGCCGDRCRTGKEGQGSPCRVVGCMKNISMIREIAVHNKMRQ
jgi:hypothetical protein